MHAETSSIGAVDKFLLEIKSGQIVTQDYFKVLPGITQTVGERIKGGHGEVFYGGATPQISSDWQVWLGGHLLHLLVHIEKLFMDL